ncbi:MAG: response regulator [bacterium]|nr:response regulator [bacterium]
MKHQDPINNIVDGSTQSGDTAEEIRVDPTGEVFRTLFDIGEIQEIQDAFAEASGVGSIIAAPDGVPITKPSNFCRLCNDIIRQTEVGLRNCIKSDALIGCYNPDGPTIQLCLSGGLWDGSASITAGDIHIGSWLIGQVRDEDIDVDRMRAYAREIGADEDEFLSALNEVTVMPRARFEAVTRMLFMVANQMSERALQNQRQRRMLDEQNRLRQIIDVSPAVAFRWRNEESWPVEYVSNNVEGLTGYTADEFQSSKVLYSEIIHTDDLERVAGEVISASADLCRVEFVHQPYRVITKSGEVKWVDDRTSIVRGEDGAPLKFDGIIMDATERIRFEAEREAVREKLARADKLELLGTVAGGVAHDLNNILGAMLGYPELFLADMDPADQLYRPLLTIGRSASRAADIVQDLLTLSRRGVVDTVVLNLNDVIRAFLASSEFKKLQASKPAVQVDLDQSDDLLNIMGSATHLTRMLLNLLINAFEALPEEGGTIKIRTRNTYVAESESDGEPMPEGDYVHLSVADSGPGIPPEDLTRIFEPFHTTKIMGLSGTGLGMAVIHGTVEDHKGWITAESEVGCGTDFRIHFPIVRDRLTVESQSTLDDIKGHGESVLVIDDIDIQRDTAVTLLTNLGYSVMSVASGEEAIEFLRNSKIDLLILDMIMDPGIDGLETFKRAVMLKPDQLAIITSGYSETDKVQAARRAGAGAYLKKPYTLSSLGQTVKSVLARGAGS